MHAVFISYASGDRPAASSIERQLHAFYDVFLDARSIPGGTRWQQEIDEAIRRAAAVVVLASPAAAASPWVEREVALAAQLGKPLVPVLLGGELPPTLAALQYIDFRAAPEGAIADLLRALAVHVAPTPRQGHEADHLLAAAVRARLAGRTSTADELFARAAALDPTLAVHQPQPWQQLARAPAAGPRIEHVTVTERTTALGDSTPGSRRKYRWSLHIGGPPGLPAQIDAVHYELHRSFRPPRQTVRSPGDGFRLTCIGWGRFEVGITLELIGGQRHEVHHLLSFEPHTETRFALPAAR